MVATEWIEAEVLKAVPDAQVEAIDLHRSGDHFHVRVISESFDGMRPLQRQRLVLAVMKQHIPHPIHALDLKCMTPAQAVDKASIFVESRKTRNDENELDT